MREALRGLTVRGRAFLAAGLTAIVCAVLLGQSTLLQVGGLVALLPIVCVVFLGRSRYRLSLVRSAQPQVVPAGSPTKVSLTLANEGSAPSGVLLLEDQVPYVLGSRPRFVLEGIGQGWRRTISYQVRSDVRGRYQIGPMTVRVSDPFGMVELGRAFKTTTSLTVTPRTVPLPGIMLGGGWTGSGDNRPRAFATGSAEDLTVREYRRGDELRRVHWRSSAKVGELMVRREEQPWQSRATLFLDNRIVAHRGHGIASSFETAVSVVASVAVHLGQRGFTVRLITATGEEEGSLRAGPGGGWHERHAGLDTASLLEELAVLEPVGRATLDTSWLGEQSQGGVTIGVFGHLQAGDVAACRRIRRHTSSALAIALDAAAWTASGQTRTGADPGSATSGTLLRGLGWRTAGLGPRDRIATAWQELGRHPAHTRADTAGTLDVTGVAGVSGAPR